MANTPEEWMRQAEYDIETAQAMFDSKRYVYSVFMCHLSAEKALKAVRMAHLKQMPPRTHNLIYLMKAVPLSFSEEQSDLFLILNRACIATRYPEELNLLVAEFPETKTGEILKQAREIIQWLKSELRKSRST
jgi:HEPN domain-containing protein